LGFLSSIHVLYVLHIKKRSVTESFALSQALGYFPVAAVQGSGKSDPCEFQIAQQIQADQWHLMDDA
jgi:hypothetical protein